MDFSVPSTSSPKPQVTREKPKMQGNVNYRIARGIMFPSPKLFSAVTYCHTSENKLRCSAVMDPKNLFVLRAKEEKKVWQTVSAPEHMKLRGCGNIMLKYPVYLSFSALTYRRNKISYMF